MTPRLSIFLCMYAALLTQGSCRSPLTDKESGPTVSIVELETVQWRIGDLDAETVLLLEDGIPAHQTTVTNSNETDRWWTGLKVYWYSASGTIPPVNTDPISDEEFEKLTDEEIDLRIGSLWGARGGQACRSSSALPEISKGTVLIRPGETRSYHDSHPNYPTSPKRETVTSWSLEGRACLPSKQPFEEWPPFQIDLDLSWDKEDGCSVGSTLIQGSVRGRVLLEGAAPEPYRAPLDEGMQEAFGVSEFVSERWLVGPEGGLANCAISLRPIEGTEVPPIEPIEDAYFDKVGPYYRPQVLLVTTGTPVTLRNQESLCGGFHGRAAKNQSFNRIIPPGEEHTWLAERAEVVPVVCDVQPYVQGTIVVVDTPYYAMTDADGSFRIRDVAPGTYALRAFHEGLGRWIRRQRVEVDWGQSVSLELRTSATPK